MISDTHSPGALTCDERDADVHELPCDQIGEVSETEGGVWLLVHAAASPSIWSSMLFHAAKSDLRYSRIRSR